MSLLTKGMADAVVQENVSNDRNETFYTTTQFSCNPNATSCDLKDYGCDIQVDSCSFDNHLLCDAHVKALIKCLTHLFQSTGNINCIRDLTEYVSRSINSISETEESDQSDSINDLIAYNLPFENTRANIELEDHCQGSGASMSETLNRESTQIEITRQLLENCLAQSDNETTNDLSIVESSSTHAMSSSSKACHSCKASIDATSIAICKKCYSNIVTNIKSKEDSNIRLSRENERLIIMYDICQTERKEIPDSTNGCLVWKVGGISQKIRDLYSQRAQHIDSPRFLTITGEHPMNARLCLFGGRHSFPNFVSVHILLNPGGKSSLNTTIICCLVDQTNRPAHIQQKRSVQLDRNNIGILCSFDQFVEKTELNQPNSRFVNDDTIYIIVKICENDLNPHKNYPLSVQDALRAIT